MTEQNGIKNDLSSRKTLFQQFARPGLAVSPAAAEQPYRPLDPTAPVHWVHPKGRHGRGAHSNESGRFEPLARLPIDDGWGDGWERLEDLPIFKTEVTRETARQIVTRNQSPDISFDRSVNPYRGCEHGCAYCFARPTHAYMGLSPGLDFESRLFAKPNAAALLEKELSKPGYQARPMAIGTNTDPYQPIERTYRITRQVLEVLSAFQHPVAIVTKSALVTRDMDLLAPMAEKGLVRVALSVTTLERKLARAMEPRATAPAKRMEALRLLSAAGIPTAIMVAPVIPALNDHEIEKILAGAARAGAQFAGFVTLRLPLEIKDLFRDWLESHYPDRATHILSLVRAMHGGKDYDAQWNRRMRGVGPYAWTIGRRFELAAKRHGLNLNKEPLNCDLFHPPPKKGDQLSLFEGAG